MLLSFFSFFFYTHAHLIERNKYDQRVYNSCNLIKVNLTIQEIGKSSNFVIYLLYLCVFHTVNIILFFKFFFSRLSKCLAPWLKRVAETYCVAPEHAIFHLYHSKDSANQLHTKSFVSNSSQHFNKTLRSKGASEGEADRLEKEEKEEKAKKGKISNPRRHCYWLF